MRTPNKSIAIEEQEPMILAAMLAFGEARGEGFDGMLNVLCVVRNRVNHPTWWGKTLKDVILKKWQFSAFNANDPNRYKMMDPLAHEPATVWERCMNAADAVFGDYPIGDLTGGATHYFDTRMPEPPAWAEKMQHTTTLGHHAFYK